MLCIQWKCFCFLWSFLICIGSQIDPFPTVKHLYCKRREPKSAKGCSLVCLFSKFDIDYMHTEVKVRSQQLSNTESSRNYAVCRIIYFMIMHIMSSFYFVVLGGFPLRLCKGWWIYSRLWSIACLFITVLFKSQAVGKKVIWTLVRFELLHSKW